MFQIVEIQPIHCQFTDGIIGSRAANRSHCYETEALAHKLAAIYSDRNYQDHGDDCFVVVNAGESPFLRPLFSPSNASDLEDMPF